jgi:hypothetical protein
MSRLARIPTAAIPPSPPSPPVLDLLSAALARGADGEVLDRLIGFHERLQAQAARRAFDKALAAAKAKIPIIAKNRTAMVRRQPYRHEDLAEIARTITPVLARNGLSYRFRSQSTGALVTVVCVISHRDGHSEENSLSASPDESGEKNSIQAVGSTLTYLQRMTLKAALGLAASDDDDGQAAGSSALISRQQARELLDLIEVDGADKDALLQFFQIKGVTDLPATRFRQALTMLNSRRTNG